MMVTSTVILASIVVYCIYWVLSRHRGLSLPPGPKMSTITGDLSHLSEERPWLRATEWGTTYGPLVFIQVFNNRTLFLNSAKVALDLLDSRSSIYSERPICWMALLADRQASFFRTSFSDQRFKPLRRLVQDGLTPRAMKSYHPIILRENVIFMKALVNAPNDFRAHIRRNAMTVIMRVAYGYQVSGNDDPLVRTMEDSIKIMYTIYSPLKHWVEFIPLLRFIPSWFPGAGFKRYAKRINKDLALVENLPFESATKSMLSGDYVESIISKQLVDENGLSTDPLKKEYVKWGSSAVYLGGRETIAPTLTTFFLVMALHPELQKKAQADIDQLLSNSLPTINDFNSLPYIRAIIKEIVRWAPATPLGLPHSVLTDDVYENYFIPKGTRVYGNIWAIAHDAEVYPDPFHFDPSRHLGDKPELDPFKYIFGFGKRICPGAHLAELLLFLNVTRLLALFDISLPVDEHGNAIEQKIDWAHFDTCLQHFDCRVTPRSEEHLVLLGRQQLEA